MRLLRSSLFVGLTLLALAAFGWRSGNEPRLDAIAEARESTGVALEAGCVDVAEGVRLHVVQAGPIGGPPVVLLHGFPEFWYAWRDVIPPLVAAGHRVIVPDQRGYGDSSKPAAVEEYCVDRLGDDIATLITALGHENACVAAHDWGGGVAWNLTLRHPERVRRLVILDTPHPDPRWLTGPRSRRASARGFARAESRPDRRGHARTRALGVAHLPSIRAAGADADRGIATRGRWVA